MIREIIVRIGDDEKRTIVGKITRCCNCSHYIKINGQCSFNKFRNDPAMGYCHRAHEVTNPEYHWFKEEADDEIYEGEEE